MEGYEIHLLNMRNIISEGTSELNSFRGINVYHNPRIVLSNLRDHLSDYTFELKSIEDGIKLTELILEEPIDAKIFKNTFKHLDYSKPLYFHLLPESPLG